jgi:2,4-dienoyl-CoA reductase-like NADH-dependent reductase (Old Yellow Enzyme family)
VIESCATHVTENGQGWQGEWGIYDDRHTPDWKRAADSMHAHGALLFAQLFHGGERAMRVEGRVPISAAASGTPGGKDEVRAASTSDIEHVIEAFVAAARRAESAGADGIELHGAHGYVLCQFLRADLNNRTDGWGDTLEGRARMIRTVLQEIRKRVSPQFVIGVRLSPENGGFMKGLDLDESVQTAQWLCEDGADFIHVSLWDAHKNTTKRPEEHPTTVFAKALPSEVPIITAGKLWTTEDADHQLQLGASAVALGRAAITTQDWPLRVVRDAGEPFWTPVSADHLREQNLGETFVAYMKRWAGFVSEEDGGKAGS